MIPDAVYPDERQTCVAWARLRIEAMSDMPPMHSEVAYTSRGTQFTGFWQYFQPGDRWLTQMTERLINDVLRFRDTANCPQLLVWRALPVIENTPEGVCISARLCFETDHARAEQENASAKV